MAKFRIATPAGASFTVAGGGYGYEMEALTPIDAEIYEIPPGSEDEFVAAAKDADALYAKGRPITKKMIDGSAALQNHLARQRRRRHRRCRGGDREGHPGDQLPGYFHRGSRRSCDDLNPRHPSPIDRTGSDGPRGTLVRRPAGIAQDPAPARHDLGADRVWPCRPGGRRARQTLRSAHHRL